MNIKATGFELRSFSKEFARENVTLLQRLSMQIPGDYWELEHYLADLNGKWELSRAAYYKDVLSGFLVLSAKPLSLHINRIVVAPEMHNKGLGGRLAEYAIESTVKVGKEWLTLKVDQRNNNAIRFYERLNFQRTGMQDNLILMALKVRV